MKLPLKKEEAPGRLSFFTNDTKKGESVLFLASWGTDWLEFNIPHVGGPCL